MGDVARSTLFPKNAGQLCENSFSGLRMTVGITMAAAVYAVSLAPALAQASGDPSTTPTAVPKTPWGEPDLQGRWTDENDTPPQRLAKYAIQEFFTQAQRADLDRERAALLAEDRASRRRYRSAISPRPTMRGSRPLIPLLLARRRNSRPISPCSPCSPPFRPSGPLGAYADGTATAATRNHSIPIQRADSRNWQQQY